jgi:hypothetical protein
VRVGRENLRRTIHSHTFRAATHIHIFIHDKPCAAIEVVYNTNPIVNISLNFFFFSSVLPSIEKKKRAYEKERHRERERGRDEKNGLSARRRRQPH